MAAGSGEGRAGEVYRAWARGTVRVAAGPVQPPASRPMVLPPPAPNTSGLPKEDDSGGGYTPDFDSYDDGGRSPTPPWKQNKMQKRK
mgnify:CR=1 FL=1